MTEESDLFNIMYIFNEKLPVTGGENGGASRKPSSQFAENSKLKKNRAFNIIKV